MDTQFKNKKIRKAQDTEDQREQLDIPESGDGGEVGGWSHDAERDDSEGELRESQGKASTSSGHALNVLHPPPRQRVLSGRRVGCRRRRFHRVDWRSACIHRSGEKPHETSQRS